MNRTTLVGQTLGRYAIRQLLGTGGMGMVYRAWDLAGRREVALKTLAPEGRRRNAIDRFRREAIWLSRCDDPHIVPVYDTGQLGGIDYIAMELMTTTLQARVTEGTADVAELVGVGAEILLGLAAAHRVGVIHRDVKPANVGLSASGVVKLLDFGVADTRVGPLPEDSPTSGPDLSCYGSIHYMPPEQLRGEVVDERADVYSTGVVLYELATGFRPFPQLRAACLVDAIFNADPIPPSVFNPTATQALDRVILQALAKRPARRFVSALAMMDALLRVWARAGAASPRTLARAVPARAARPSGAMWWRVHDSSQGRHRPIPRVAGRRPVGSGIDDRTSGTCAHGRRDSAQSVA